MKTTKYNHKFDEFIVLNRWKKRKWQRSGSWVWLGIGIRFHSHCEYAIYLSLFGIDLMWWFTRMLKIASLDK